MEDYAELVDDGTRQAGADLLAGGQLRRTQDLFDRLADHRDSSVKIAAIRQKRVVRTASLLGNVERRQDAREDGRCIKVMEMALGERYQRRADYSADETTDPGKSADRRRRRAAQTAPTGRLRSIRRGSQDEKRIRRGDSSRP